MTEQIREQFAELAEMRDEELHPDLRPYVVEGGFSGRMICHRLIHDPFPINGMVNRAYLLKKAALAEAESKQDWRGVLGIIERPYRCEALIDYVLGRDEHDVPLPVTTLTDPHLRDLVAWVWTDSENIHQHVDDWLAITDGHNPGDPLLFGDQAAFDSLAPDDDRGRIEVWRGDCDDGGWSWTTDRKIAEFFCARWSENNDLLHGYVDKRYVFGYLLSRGESEVMVRREHVEDLSRTPYPGT